MRCLSAREPNPSREESWGRGGCGSKRHRACSTRTDGELVSRGLGQLMRHIGVGLSLCRVRVCCTCSGERGAGTGPPRAGRDARSRL
eukprot:5423663-Prymnesium_polylepis.1